MEQTQLPRTVEYRDINSLLPNPRNTKVHSKKQLNQIARSMETVGNITPIIIDEGRLILSGHGRAAAAKLLKMRTVPTIMVSGLTEAQKRVFAIAENKLVENSGWHRENLAKEFADLTELLEPVGLDLTVTGFSIGEIDQLFNDLGSAKADPGDAVPPLDPVAVTRPGDLWQLGHHRILNGDARSQADIARLMDGERARMSFNDPPYNVEIAGHVQGRGRIKHREFAFASGEMGREEFTAFLTFACKNVAEVCRDGAIVFVCMDWRHIGEMLDAGRMSFTEYKNLVVWNKSTPGQGSFYRSQHELIGVFKVGTGQHLNSFELGQHGRMRSNVWAYPGANSFRPGRMADLAMHPTVKPIALVADAMRDCSMKGDIVLDAFLGSGTTIMAAEKVGRRGYGLEYDTAYVDVAVRRWQAYTKQDAVLAGTGRTFEEVATERGEAVKGGSGDGAPAASVSTPAGPESPADVHNGEVTVSLGDES